MILFWHPSINSEFTGTPPLAMAGAKNIEDAPRDSLSQALLGAVQNGRIGEIRKALTAEPSRLGALYLHETQYPTPAAATPMPLLCVAAAETHGGALETLLELGAALDQPATDGRVPLMLAASVADVGLVKLLLGRGANPLLLDELGRSASDYAREMGRQRPNDPTWERCVRQCVEMIDAGAEAWRCARARRRWRVAAWVVVVLREWQARAAERAYAPGGLGFAEANERFRGMAGPSVGAAAAAQAEALAVPEPAVKLVFIRIDGQEGARKTVVPLVEGCDFDQFLSRVRCRLGIRDDVAVSLNDAASGSVDSIDRLLEVDESATLDVHAPDAVLPSQVPATPSGMRPSASIPSSRGAASQRAPRAPMQFKLTEPSIELEQPPPDADGEDDLMARILQQNAEVTIERKRCATASVERAVKHEQMREAARKSEAAVLGLPAGLSHMQLEAEEEEGVSAVESLQGLAAKTRIWRPKDGSRGYVVPTPKDIS